MQARYLSHRALCDAIEAFWERAYLLVIPFEGSFYLF